MTFLPYSGSHKKLNGIKVKISIKVWVWTISNSTYTYLIKNNMNRVKCFQCLITSSASRYNQLWNYNTRWLWVSTNINSRLFMHIQNAKFSYKCLNMIKCMLIHIILTLSMWPSVMTSGVFKQTTLLSRSLLTWKAEP